MSRPLRVLFATAHPHLPQIAGGLQASTDETMKGLMARGHDVRLLCGLTGAGTLGLRHRIALKLSSAHVACDDSLGYPVLRAWHPPDPAVVADVLGSFPADVLLAQGGSAAELVAAFARSGVPGAIYFRNVEFDSLRALVPQLDPATAYISNSQFTRGRAEQVLCVQSTVIYPLVDAGRYRVATTGEKVVFINPHPSKGVALACDLAALCPDIPFLFVEAWTLQGPEHEATRARIRSLPNVTLMHRTSDMAAIYGQARIVLVPSQWEEAFGRVVAEAQCSGIPALASSIGGLPEAVGQGGTLLPPDAPAHHWAAALRCIWDDPAEQARLSQAARAHSARTLDPAQQLDRLEQVLRDRIAADLRHKGVLPPNPVEWVK